MLKPPFQLTTDTSGRECYWRTDTQNYNGSQIYSDDVVALLKYIAYLETTIIKLTNMFKD